MTAPRKLFIKTYGCQMNVYDSERMAESLGGAGYTLSDNVEGADMVLLNTCHIREKAAEKLYSDLGRIKKIKADHPNMKVAVAGCVAQAEGGEIMRRAPVVDLVVGPQSYHRLPALEAEIRTGKRALDTEFPPEDKFDHLPKRSTLGRATAFLTVQEGCDKFCAFCVVPYTRGAEVSRAPQRILAEAAALVEKGVREIMLLGQNVNGYHGSDGGKDWGLAQLIRALCDMEGLERVRYTTSHPNDMEDDLIRAHGECEKLMPYLHLPVQSGSDTILKAMNRKHTAQDYLRLIERIRAARPDLLLSSDFIVGFPGETDADFEATLALVETVGFASAYSFKYSARPGTPAAERPNVPKDVSDARLQTLQQLISRQQKDAQDSMLGRELTVLFEKPGREPGQMVGKSEYLHAVHVAAPDVRAGDLRRVRIVKSMQNSLTGALLDDATGG
jgi:tRNA-2-methylthio-N6-dimethylallyladenosine synthase